MRSLFIFGVLLACDSGHAPVAPGPTSVAMRVAFGDCVQGDAPFVSGPRPVGPEDRLGAPPRSQPLYEKAQPPATGELDAETINRVVRQHASEIRQCYQRALANAPDLAGKVKVAFTIGASGAVIQASATGMAGGVGPCVEKAIKALQFPATGSESHITYPFIFTNGSAKTGAVGDSLQALVPDGKTLAPLPRPTPPPPPASGSGAHGQMPVQSVAWESGGTSPLRGQRAGIEACVKQAGQSAGVFVVALDFGERAEATLAFEGAPPALATCLGALKIQKPPGAPSRERCGVAFGTSALDVVPAIAITASDLLFGGKPVAQVSALVADAAADQLPALTAALTAWAKAQPGQVALRGVGMIEPAPATPMKLVYRAIRSAYLAEVELVLAAETNGAWKPLRAVATPVEPIAAGTGGSWNDARHGTLAGDVADLRPRLSVYVQAERIWVGLSGVMQFQEVPGRDWKKLAEVLREHKKSPAFSARTDFELAAEDAIPYSEIVQAITVAGQAGWTDWRVMGSGELAAAPTL